MQKTPRAESVLFLDSGIGGIPYYRHFRGRNPNRAADYLADRVNFPYGGRDAGELRSILAALVERIGRDISPGIVALACNSASIAALADLRGRFPQTRFVGTVPAVKPAALASRTGRIAVLATELTARDPYIRELGERHGGREIVGIAAPELVDFVENRLDSAGADERASIARGYIDRARESGADALVLGCTHFLFMEEDFRREAAPDVAVFDSLCGISDRLESLLPPPGGGAPKPGRLYLTGSDRPEPSWELWAQRMGCEISLLEEL